MQPLGVGECIGIDVGNDFACRRVEPLISRFAYAPVFGYDQGKGIAFGNLLGVIRGPVVDDDHLVIGVGQRGE